MDTKTNRPSNNKFFLSQFFRETKLYTFFYLTSGITPEKLGLAHQKLLQQENLPKFEPEREKQIYIFTCLVLNKYGNRKKPDGTKSTNH